MINEKCSKCYSDFYASSCGFKVYLLLQVGCKGNEIFVVHDNYVVFTTGKNVIVKLPLQADRAADQWSNYSGVACLLLLIQYKTYLEGYSNKEDERGKALTQGMQNQVSRVKKPRRGQIFIHV